MDIKTWNESRLTTEKQIRELKRIIRKGGTRILPRWSCLPTGKWGYADVPLTTGPGQGLWEDWKRLGELKAQATALYVERAAARGRTHLRAE